MCELEPWCITFLKGPFFERKADRITIFGKKMLLAGNKGSVWIGTCDFWIGNFFASKISGKKISNQKSGDQTNFRKSALIGCTRGTLHQLWDPTVVMDVMLMVVGIIIQYPYPRCGTNRWRFYRRRLLYCII